MKRLLERLLYLPFVFEEEGGGGGGDGGGDAGGAEEKGSGDDDAPASEGAGGEGDDDDAFDAERAKTKIQKANREAANLRKRLKDLEPLAKKAKDLEDANKSDQEKAEERASGLEQRAIKAETDVARLKVALKKGLTETQAKRLVGENEEELEADAEELLESFKSEDDDGQVPRRPRERLRPGAAPATEPEENDPAKLADKVSRW